MYIRIIMCKIVGFQKIMWHNTRRSTKSETDTNLFIFIELWILFYIYIYIEREREREREREVQYLGDVLWVPLLRFYNVDFFSRDESVFFN